MEDLAILEAAYFLLLAVGYMVLADPRKSEGLGFTIFLLSLIPPTIGAAKHYFYFASWFAEFLRRNPLAHAALAFTMFLVLLGLFDKFSLCRDKELGGYLGCFLMALGAATVGSVVLFLQAAAGALAVALALIHYVATGAVYGVALRTRERGYPSLVQGYLQDLKRACSTGDPERALTALYYLHRISKEADPSGEIGREVAEVARYLEYLLERGDYQQARGLLSGLRRKAEDWEARLSLGRLRR